MVEGQHAHRSKCLLYCGESEKGLHRLDSQLMTVWEELGGVGLTEGCVIEGQVDVSKPPACP